VEVVPLCGSARIYSLSFSKKKKKKKKKKRYYLEKRVDEIKRKRNI
jgi:hypothetical protein|tara:strand:+ start:176 stop:313 length:138 start_codon:yes stop_codon:yes gene_type:complete